MQTAVKTKKPRKQAVSGCFWAMRTYRGRIKDDHKIDPCMGSGHILVYAFDVLMQIYESAGYGQRDAAKSILENNLYGLDIDDRAFQMAYFAVMMKARQYNRRILNGEHKPNVYSIQESNGINREQLKYFGARLNEFEKKKAVTQISRLLNTFKDAKEYGSILSVERYDWDLLDRFVSQVGTIGQLSFETVGLDDTAEQLRHLIEQGIVLAQKYHVATTNPPYMGLKQGMPEKLSSYVMKHFSDSKSDLYAVFIDHLLDCICANGYLAMITQHSWMFQSFFKKIRKKVLSQDIVNMAHLGARAFEEIAGEVVQTTSFVVRRTNIPLYLASYSRLTNGESQDKENAFLAHKEIYHSAKFNYEKIDDEPISYWLSSKTYDAFKNKKIGDYGYSFQGIITGQTEINLKLWFELEFSSICFGNTDTSILEEIDTYFPYMKGGSFRRWYGNKDYIIHWHNGGKHFTRSRTENRDYFFKKGVTWSDLSTGLLSCRKVDKGYLFDASGPMLFVANENNYYVLLGYLNSKVFQAFLNINSQGLHYGNGAIMSLPTIVDNIPCDRIVNDCVQLSKKDWDSFETSWDFECHPLAKKGLSRSHWNTDNITIEECFRAWEDECYRRFEQLKLNEEELNRIFIDIYGLEDEITPEVEDKDITVRCADRQRDIRSLLSYAVGCMFGRYSLNSKGLAYAGGEWDERKYGQFKPEVDNIIPISDEEYLEDDIVSRLCTFLKIAFGEGTVEENLDYIAKALGNKGGSSREVIRNYFLNDFFKDHCQTYSVTGSGKRPIYWLFDSGKQNGFKALIYLHRYNADTIGNLRIDYLHRIQRIYESEISRMQDMIDHSTNAREVAQATKRREKLTKQLKECRDYDEKLAHLALSRIELDLDDGVKKNYRKIQTANDGKFYEVLADSKNIMSKE